jgi:hypothetical protein
MVIITNEILAPSLPYAGIVEIRVSHSMIKLSRDASTGSLLSDSEAEPVHI